MEGGNGRRTGRELSFERCVHWIVKFVIMDQNYISNKNRQKSYIYRSLFKIGNYNYLVYDDVFEKLLIFLDKTLDDFMDLRWIFYWDISS